MLKKQNAAYSGSFLFFILRYLYKYYLLPKERLVLLKNWSPYHEPIAGQTLLLRKCNHADHLSAAY